MKILLDHCVPKPFGRALTSHDVKTTAQMGWATLQNGKLLTEAAKSFDAFITVDKNIKNQQNLQSLPLSIIVLNVTMNTPKALALFAPYVEVVLPTLTPGRMIEIDATGAVTEIAPRRTP